MQLFCLFHHHKQQVSPKFLMLNILYVRSNYRQNLYIRSKLNKWFFMKYEYLHSISSTFPLLQEVRIHGMCLLAAYYQ